MKRNANTIEFFYQVAALLLAIAIVQVVYVSVIRPRADAHLKKEREMMLKDESYVQQRNGFVLVSDYEQQACVVLAFWALAIIGFKTTTTLRERRLMGEELIPLEPGMRILPEDSRELSRKLEALPEGQRRSCCS